MMSLRTVNNLIRFYKHVILVLLETKISGSRANEQVKKFGFSSHFRIETEGLSNGIWLFWHSDLVKINIISQHFQCFQCFTYSSCQGCSWLFMTIYASPNDQQRPLLW